MLGRQRPIPRPPPEVSRSIPGHRTQRSTAGRPAPSNTTAPSFQFSATEAGSTFQCSLDTPSGQGTYAACTSPQAYTTTANGAYTFSVRATDAVGNVDPTPASRDVHGRHGRAGHDDHGRSDGHDRTTPRRRSSSRAPSRTRRSSAASTVPAPRPARTSRARRRARSARSPTARTRSTSARRDAAGNMDASRRDAQLHGRDRRARHDDHGRPVRADQRRVAVVRVHLDRGRARRSSAGWTAGGRRHVRRAARRRRRYATPAERRATRSPCARPTPPATPTRRPRRAPSRSTRPRRTRRSTRPDRHDQRRPRRRSRSPRARRARRSSAASTRGATAGTCAACTSPRILGSLADGAYTFKVRATDAAGNVDATPATRTFTVDTAAPDTTIDSGPTGTTTNATPHVRVHRPRRPARRSSAGSTARARPPARTRAAPRRAPRPARRRRVHVLGPRDRRRRQRRRDAGHARRSRSTPRRRTRRSPAARPARPTSTPRRSRSPSSEAGSTFECRLDGRRAFAAVHLAADLHRAGATARTRSRSARRDAAGNIDADARTRTFTVDTAAPDTTITSGPTGTDERRPRRRSRSRRPRRARRSSAASDARPALRGLHLAAGLRRRLADGAHTFDGPRHRRRRQRRRRRPRRGRSRSTRPRRTRRSTRARPARSTTTTPTFTFSGTEAGVDVRVQARRPGATYRHLHLAADLHDAWPRARTRSRSAHATPPATSTRRPRRARSRSTRSRRTRRSLAGRPARSNTASPRSRSPPARRARRSSASSTGRARDGHVRELHVAAHARPARRRHVHVLGPRHRRRRQRRRHARHARRSRSTRPRRTRRSRAARPARRTRVAVVRVHVDRSRARRSSAALGRRRAFAACTSPQAYRPLTRRAPTRSRSARPTAPATSTPTPATRTFTVDTAAPDTTIDTGPTGTINDDVADVHVLVERDRLDVRVPARRPRRRDRHYATCTSPRASRSLADGTYTFPVRATDAAGNVDATPATRTFTVDTDRAGHDDHAARRAPSASRRATFTFSSTEAGLDVRVPLDGRRGTFAACTSPRPTPASPTGAHTFAVRATDAAGNVDATPATRTFTVDTRRAGHDDHVRPDRADQQRDRRRSRSPPPKAGSTFECKLDSPTAPARSPPARRRRPTRRSPTARTRSPSARPTRPATSTRRRRRARSRSTRRAPDTTITRGPTGTTSVATPTFTFPARRPARRSSASSTAGAGTFAACTSPQAYIGLADGAHTFAVRAIDAAGNVDATPATRTCTVDTAAPDTTITGGPDGPTSNARRPSPSTASRPARRSSAARRPGRGHRHLRGVHLAARRRPARRRRVHVLGPRDRRAPATSTRRPPRGRSRSTPRRRTRRSPAARRARSRRTPPTFAFTSRGRARRSSASSTPPAYADLRDCTSPQAYTRLADGAHTFSVRAEGRAPATSTRRPRPGRSRSTPPRPTRRSRAARPARRTTNRRRSRSPRASRARRSSAARSDRRRHVRGLHVAAGVHGLADGAHTFSVRAKDAAGNVDATPATRTFTVDTRRAGHDHHRRPDRADHRHHAVVHVHERSGRDVRVQARHARPARARTPPARRRSSTPRPTWALHVLRARQGCGGQRRRHAGDPHVPDRGDRDANTDADRHADADGGRGRDHGVRHRAVGPRARAGRHAAFLPFIPGVATEYQAALSARITTSAATAELTVVDQGAQPGRLVNGTHAMVNALEARRHERDPAHSGVRAHQRHPAAAAPVPDLRRRRPRRRSGSGRRIGATEPLWAGAYEKTLTFTLSTTQP